MMSRLWEASVSRCPATLRCTAACDHAPHTRSLSADLRQLHLCGLQPLQTRGPGSQLWPGPDRPQAVTIIANVTRLGYMSSSQECVRARASVLPPAPHHPHHAPASNVLGASPVLGQREARQGDPANQANIFLAKLKQNPEQ